MVVPGKKLAHYQVVESIGAGGMGEVFRAKDTKLGRDVAIKALPADFANDGERLARFEREARVLASLNHPNIAAIHGLEEDGGEPFLVLELVEGEDLAERLKRGPIPVDEVIEIAKQVAEALEEAHEKGIIHRDLKPANVKLTPEGVVKVLDFGLAKAFHGDGAQPNKDLSDSPTMTRNATAAGVVLGTAAYMSPEQAKGKGVDRRTDIWAFGALAYEMLTGKKAFAGDDISETLAAILRDEPDWNRLPKRTPSNLRALLERCLRKNPRERQRDMGDARLELSTSNVQAVALPERRHGRAVAAFILGALVVAVPWSMDRSPPPAVTKMVIPLPEGQTLVARESSPVAVSPDGRTIVYAAEDGGASHLYRRPLDVDVAMAIPGTEGGHTPFYSPDGQWIGFFTADALKKIPVSGGAAMTLAPTEGTNLGAGWGPDGDIVYVPDAGADTVLMRILQGGGEPEALTQTGQPANPMSPQVLADGDTVLFKYAGTSMDDLMKLSLRSGDVSKLEAPPGALAYLPTGHLLHWSADSIAATSFDVESGRAEGDSAVVLESIASYGVASTHATPYLSVSTSGTLAYAAGARGEGRLARVDRNGNARTLTAEGNFHAPRVSPDGSRVAYDSDDIWIFDIARGTETRLSVERNVGIVAWRPDGRGIAFPRFDTIYEIPADGGGNPSIVFDGAVNINAVEDWSHDGKHLILTAANPSTGLDLWVLPIGGEPTPFLVTAANENGGRFSPDGRYIAYISDESGQDEVYVRRFGESEARWKISSDGGTAPVWSADGAELFYRRGQDLMAVKIERGSDFSAGRPELLLSGDYHVDATGHAGFDVMPDGDSFIMIELTRDAPLTEIHVVLNWYQELNRLVPID